MSSFVRGTVADVDLDAIAANVALLRARAAADLIVVVKADAYGHGAEAVAGAVLAAGAAMLAVATVEEAMLLRRAGIAAEILVLLGATDRAEADAAVAARCTLAVWDVARARLAADAARAAGTTVALHVKADTGLTRLGAPAEEAAARVAAIRALPGVRLEGLFTHLATADSADQTVARDQLRSFDDVLRGVPDRPRWVHALNSAGVGALGHHAGTTAARVGIAVYGIQPAAVPAAALPLRAALSWRARVLRVASVPAGTGVGYGHEYHRASAGAIATLAVGYGDGLARSAWPHAGVLVAERWCPVAGRISMALTTVDVSDAAGVRDGDEAVLVGEQGAARQDANTLAGACGTIGYEIVTAIHARVPRRYRRAGRVVATKTLAGGYVEC